MPFFSLILATWDLRKSELGRVSSYTKGWALLLSRGHSVRLLWSTFPRRKVGVTQAEPSRCVLAVFCMNDSLAQTSILLFTVGFMSLGYKTDSLRKESYRYLAHGFRRLHP